MTKIEEIIEKVNNKHEGMYGPRPSMKIIHQYMKEYAEYYAKKVLEIAAVEVDCYDRGYDLGHDVNTDSILNIKLPEHE